MSEEESYEDDGMGLAEFCADIDESETIADSIRAHLHHNWCENCEESVVGAEGAGKCGACQSVHYCSQECAEEDYEFHEKECAAIQNNMTWANFEDEFHVEEELGEESPVHRHRERWARATCDIDADITMDLIADDLIERNSGQRRRPQRRRRRKRQIGIANRRFRGRGFGRGFRRRFHPVFRGGRRFPWWWFLYPRYRHYWHPGMDLYYTPPGLQEGYAQPIYAPRTSLFSIFESIGDEAVGLTISVDRGKYELFRRRIMMRGKRRRDLTQRMADYALQLLNAVGRDASIVEVLNSAILDLVNGLNGTSTLAMALADVAREADKLAKKQTIGAPISAAMVAVTEALPSKYRSVEIVSSLMSMATSMEKAITASDKKKFYTHASQVLSYAWKTGVTMDARSEMKSYCAIKKAKRRTRRSYHGHSLLNIDLF
jgi:hypothetical protein